MAEVVRGGLQAIPRGQYEAARAIGLGYWPMMRLIILPQALRIVIPGIVNSFISLFKDTSLVLIIGIFDLLGIVQLGFSDQNWAGPNIPATGYAFAALIFWVFCFGMSRYSHLYGAPTAHRPPSPVKKGNGDNGEPGRDCEPIARRSASAPRFRPPTWRSRWST